MAQRTGGDPYIQYGGVIYGTNEVNVRLWSPSQDMRPQYYNPLYTPGCVLVCLRVFACVCV